MSEKAKQIVVLFIGAGLIGGVITVQVRRSRPAPPVATAAPETAEPAPAAPPPLPVNQVQPEAGLPAPASAAPPQVSSGMLPGAEASGIPAPEAVELPPGEWGRNPFLTVSEIAALGLQPEPVVDIPSTEPFLPPPPEPVQELPLYTVSVIMSGERGSWAVVDSRIIRPGDRLGHETVKQITDRGVVLELDGKTREVLLERPLLSAPSAPRGTNP